MGHFLPGKSKFWKNEKNTWRYYHLTHVNHKWQSYDVWFLRYGVWQTKFSFWAIFCPFTPLTAWKIKILNKWKKNTWRCYHLTHVYHKWQSYDAWFLRCGVSQTEFYIILGHFSPFIPLMTWKIKIKKEWKKFLEFYLFTYYLFT